MSETIIQTPVSLKDFDKKCLNPQVPQEDRTDCVINSLFFLNFLDKINATKRSVFANEVKGLNEERVIREIYFSKESKLTKMNWYFLPIDTKRQGLNEILKDLKVSNGTIVIFQPEIPTQPGIPIPNSHAVAVVRISNEKIIIVDLQQGIKYESLEEVDRFLKDYRYICLLTPTFKRRRGITSPEERIARSVESQTRKKTRTKKLNTPDIKETPYIDDLISNFNKMRIYTLKRKRSPESKSSVELRKTKKTKTTSNTKSKSNATKRMRSRNSKTPGIQSLTESFEKMNIER